MRSRVLLIVMDEIREIAASLAQPYEGALNEDTRLFGKSGILDSISLVSLMVAVEQTVEDAFSVPITIASDRAMSQSRSPFRTIGSLTDWVVQLLQEAGAHV